MTTKQVDLTKNFFALGIMFWLYERDDGTDAALDRRRSSAKQPVIAEAQHSARSRPATPSARRPRSSTRTTASRRPSCAPGHVPQHHRQRGDRARLRRRVEARRPRRSFYGSYPITPARDILHQLSSYKNFGVKTFQAEDEIAAIGAAIGAAYGGALGPDRHVAARASRSRREAMGLAVMVELPLVVVDVQRAGPSTGMPTKTEQADLLQVMFGRNGDSPVADRRPGHARPSASTTRSRRGASRSST